jgi:hypothetical protein
LLVAISLRLETPGTFDIGQKFDHATPFRARQLHPFASFPLYEYKRIKLSVVTLSPANRQAG